MSLLTPPVCSIYLVELIRDATTTTQQQQLLEWENQMSVCVRLKLLFWEFVVVSRPQYVQIFNLENSKEHQHQYHTDIVSLYWWGKWVSVVYSLLAIVVMMKSIASSLDVCSVMSVIIKTWHKNLIYSWIETNLFFSNKFFFFLFKFEQMCLISIVMNYWTKYSYSVCLLFYWNRINNKKRNSNLMK